MKLVTDESTVDRLKAYCDNIRFNYSYFMEAKNHYVAYSKSIAKKGNTCHTVQIPKDVLDSPEDMQNARSFFFEKEGYMESDNVCWNYWKEHRS
jgi:hypothetical protein